MFDTRLRPLIDPPLDWTARIFDRFGVSANAMSLAGLVLAGLAAVSIAFGLFGAAFVFVALNRLADGLDGALARRQGPTDLGGFYDIVFDFWFYGAIPLAFALHDPSTNAVAAAALIASFYANGATFLAFSALAARRRLTTRAQGHKAIYYFAGLAEGFETIVVFLLMCLVPGAFFAIAFAFAAVCFLSAGVRTLEVRAALASPAPGTDAHEPAPNPRDAGDPAPNPPDAGDPAPAEPDAGADVQPPR